MNHRSLSDLGELVKKIGLERLVVIAICGVVLIYFSNPSNLHKKKSVSKNESANKEISDDYCTLCEQKIRGMILKIKGIQDAEVYITLKSGREDVILQEEGESKNTVVYYRDGSGGQSPYIVKENEPEIEGIAVIIEGDDSPENILKITNMLLALFHVESHKISVIGI